MDFVLIWVYLLFIEAIVYQRVRQHHRQFVRASVVMMVVVVRCLVVVVIVPIKIQWFHLEIHSMAFYRMKPSECKLI